MATESVDTGLGRYLKLLRIQNNLTMMQTAQLTGITQGYISQIENGIYNPSAKTLAKLARAYNIADFELLKKAGIVQEEHGQGAGPAVGDRVIEGRHALRIDEREAPQVLSQLRGSLEAIEGMLTSISIRDQAASLGIAEVQDSGEQGATGDFYLPVYDSGMQQVTNAVGQPIGMRLPSTLCAGDEEAFIMVVSSSALTPLVSSGDWVVVSPNSQPRSGSVVVLKTKQGTAIYRYFISGQQVVLQNGATKSEPPRVLDPLVVKDDLVGRVLRVINRDL